MSVLWHGFRKPIRRLLPFSCLLLFSALSALAQSQTTGRITGTVRDQRGAVIIRAEIIIASRATGEERQVKTGNDGNYIVPLLRPGAYRLTVRAGGFNPVVFDSVIVAITETTTVNAELLVAEIRVEPVPVFFAPFVKSEGPQLGRVVDSRTVSELPLATRNFTQILALSPGTSVTLADNTALGRNSQNVSVNGARVNAKQFRAQRYRCKQHRQ